MTTTYDPKITALLCIDLYNDFLSEGGKLWPWVKDVATEVRLLDNLRAIVHTAREARITIYHVPHHRWEPGDYKGWKYPRPINSAPPSGRPSPRTHGAERFMTTFRCSLAMSSQRSIGLQAVFRTPIWSTS